MSANQANMVHLARTRVRTIHAGAWAAVPENVGHGITVTVYHYSTPMFTVYPNGDAVGIDRGWGSMSDKCGVGRILRGAGANVTTYAALYA